MSKIFTQAPLPFQGQKRRWNKEFKNALKKFDDCTVFVDLFGGSGLLSRMVADQRPDACVVYNDFDGYHHRLANVEFTNSLLRDIREIVKDLPSDKLIHEPQRSMILDRVREEEEHTGYVDYITLSASILFSAKYVTSYAELLKQSFYNTVKQNDYNANGYLDGLTIVKEDYRDLFNRYRYYENVVFLIDPPYLSTDCSTYASYWKLSQYLDVLHTLRDTNYFYFTSNKSSIVELCEWLEKNYASKNPFHGATRVEQSSHVNYASKYVDIMMFKKRRENEQVLSNS